MVTLVNRAKMATATTGTGTITLGAAEPGQQTFASAGILNGDTVRYTIEDGTAWEIGTGTYSSTGPTLTRTAIESSAAGAEINLSGAARVYVTVAAGDLQKAADMDQGVATTNSPTFAGATVNGNITVTGTVDGRDVAADGTKLDGIEAGATADQTPSELLTAIKTVDGSGSGLDADLLDGVQASSFLRSDADDAFTGNLTTGANNYITFGPNSGWASYIRVGGNGRTVTGDSYASVVTTNGNLHLDAGNTRSIYLNYYGGTSGVHFGSGASSVVAVMGPDGDLWKGSADNSGSKYWHAGNDGSGSGLDADLLDGQHGSYYYSPANVPVLTSAQVGAATAGLAAGAVGTYAQMQNQSGVAVATGATVAGSALQFCSINSSLTGTPSASGTWRVMGKFVGSGTGTTSAITVCMRIS